jgi:hypothetical protein
MNLHTSETMNPNCKASESNTSLDTERQIISTGQALGQTTMKFDPPIPTFHKENEMLDKKSFLFSRSVWNVIVVLHSFSTR